MVHQSLILLGERWKLVQNTCLRVNLPKGESYWRELIYPREKVYSQGKLIHKHTQNAAQGGSREFCQLEEALWHRSTGPASPPSVSYRVWGLPYMGRMPTASAWVSLQTAEINCKVRRSFLSFLFGKPRLLKLSLEIESFIIITVIPVSWCVWGKDRPCHFSD